MFRQKAEKWRRRTVLFRPRYPVAAPSEGNVKLMFYWHLDEKQKKKKSFLSASWKILYKIVID